MSLTRKQVHLDGTSRDASVVRGGAIIAMVSEAAASHDHALLDAAHKCFLTVRAGMRVQSGGVAIIAMVSEAAASHDPALLDAAHKCILTV